MTVEILDFAEALALTERGKRIMAARIHAKAYVRNFPLIINMHKGSDGVHKAIIFKQ